MHHPGVIMFATAVIALRGPAEAEIMDNRRRWHGLPSLHADPVCIPPAWALPSDDTCRQNPE